MRSLYPSHLYIRVDRPLREALDAAAVAAETNVSALARQILRASLTPRGTQGGSVTITAGPGARALTERELEANRIRLAGLLSPEAA